MNETLDTMKALRSIPVEKVREDLQRVRSERARLAKEEALLEQVLGLHGEPDVGSAGALRTVYLTTGAPAPEMPANGSRRAQILQIMRESPQVDWSPADIIKALRANGSRARDEAVRVNLRRMVTRGELEKPEHATYRLPSNTSEQQALDSGGGRE